MSVFLGVLLLVVPGCLSVNLVEQPGAYGPDVVATVINLIRSNCILSEDKLFLRRLAYVETRDGSLPKTYANSNFDGGIWQVSRDMFRATQRNQAVLRPLYTIIQDSLHIHWQSVTWKDLRKPLYSGLAAALYITLQNNVTQSTIPLKIEEQGTFWKNHYNSGGSAYNYTEVVDELQLGCHVSNRQVDLVFLVDSSSSVSVDDFTRIKTFLKDTISGFNIGPNTAHAAVITYSSTVSVQFYLNTHYSRVAMNTAINAIHYTSGATNTAGALNSAVLDVFSTQKGGRDDAVKIAILITDGKSDDSINTQHSAQLAHLHNVAMFTVGVGNKVDAHELTAISTAPTCTHAFTANGFDSIANLKQEIQNSVCRAPLYANETVTCEIDKCPPYAFPFTGNHGITIQGSLSCGTANLFADINNFYPSSAHNLFNQVIDRAGIATYQAKPDKNANFLYVTVKDIYGHSNNCSVTLTPLVGDKTVNKVDVICKEEPSGHERPCKKEDLMRFKPLICTTDTSQVNPCTATDAQKGTKYPYTGDNSRYIQCLPNGGFQIVFCPSGLLFDPKCAVCYGPLVPLLLDCHDLYNLTNPCTAHNLLNGLFYFEYPGDRNRYLQCDIWGKPWARSCHVGYVWVEEHLTCEHPDTSYNPCGQMKVTGQRFYAYPVNHYKFIECVDALNPKILSCPSSQLWDDCVKTCLPPSRFTCGGAFTGRPYIPSVTQAPVGTQTAYVAPGAIGAPYTFPCTRQHLVDNQLYFPVQGNRHEYIQCDLVGFGYIRTCQNNYFFDPNSDTCVDGPLTIDGVIGKK